MNYNERFDYYKKIASVEPKTWTKWHYYIRVTINSLTICALIKIGYTKYYNHKSSFWKNHHSKPLSQQMYLYIPLSLFFIGLQVINYYFLDIWIYRNYYSKDILTDDQLEELYFNTYVRNEKEKKLGIK